MSDDWLTKYFLSIDPSAPPWLAGQVTGKPPECSYLVPPGLADDLREVRKLSSYVLIPDALLKPPALPPPTRRTRLRRRIEAWREQAAKRTYAIIAGYEPQDLDDW